MLIGNWGLGYTNSKDYLPLTYIQAGDADNVGTILLFSWLTCTKDLLEVGAAL